MYEWEQSLEEVNLYIETPPGVTADRVDCKITPKHIRLGIKGNPPFIDVSPSSHAFSLTSPASQIERRGTQKAEIEGTLCHTPPMVNVFCAVYLQ